MKLWRRVVCLALLWGSLLSLSSCGKAPRLDEVAQIYQQQSSVHCTIQYTNVFDAVIDGVEYNALEHTCTANAQADLTSGACQISGQLSSVIGESSSGSLEVESYGDSQGSYYRFGQYYTSSQEQNVFLSLIQLPLSLNLTQNYTLVDTQILYGSTCSVYTGTEIADDSPLRLVLGLSEGEFSLEGCAVDVTLYVYQDTGLPACVRLDYFNLSDLDISFSDSSGNHYSMRELSFQVTYQGYGTQVDTASPDDFKQAALSSTVSLPELMTGLTDQGQAEAEPDPEQPSGEENSDAIPQTEHNYSISNRAETYCYEITTPEYMALEEKRDDSVSFYYYYGEKDFERISYTICQGITHEEEELYAQSLPEFYQESQGISGVSSNGIHSITLGDFQVWYSVIYLTMDQDGQSYDVIDIYSWVEAPNGQDCLEVCITEYNGSGDGILIDPESELEYAYEAILGYHENE